MTELTWKNYAREVGEAPGPVVLGFFAPGDGPSRALEEALLALEGPAGARYRFCRVDAAGQESLAAQFDLQRLPALLFLREDQVLQRISGPRSREELQEILEDCAALPEPEGQE